MNFFKSALCNVSLLLDLNGQHACKIASGQDYQVAIRTQDLLHIAPGCCQRYNKTP